MSFNLTWSRRWRLHETRSVQGCVYEMSRDAYEALWRSEGGAMKKTPYQEVVVSVRDASGRDVDAIACKVARGVEEESCRGDGVWVGTATPSSRRRRVDVRA